MECKALKVTIVLSQFATTVCICAQSLFCATFSIILRVFSLVATSVSHCAKKVSFLRLSGFSFLSQTQDIPHDSARFSELSLSLLQDLNYPSIKLGKRRVFSEP